MYNLYLYQQSGVIYILFKIIYIFLKNKFVHGYHTSTCGGVLINDMPTLTKAKAL